MGREGKERVRGEQCGVKIAEVWSEESLSERYLFLTVSSTRSTFSTRPSPRELLHVLMEGLEVTRTLMVHLMGEEGERVSACTHKCVHVHMQERETESEGESHLFSFTHLFW